MGVSRGRLAVTMDIVTDAITLVGQHGVYCQRGGGDDESYGRQRIDPERHGRAENRAAGGDERQPDAFQ